jgi:hypothetical protein
MAHGDFFTFSEYMKKEYDVLTPSMWGRVYKNS